MITSFSVRLGDVSRALDVVFLYTVPPRAITWHIFDKFSLKFSGNDKSHKLNGLLLQIYNVMRTCIQVLSFVTLFSFSSNKRIEA